MKINKVFCIVCVFLVSVMFLTNCKKNHYKFYEAQTPVSQTFPVELRDQFNEKVLKGNVKEIRFFANPVSKNGLKIPDPQAHLTWYLLELEPQEEVKRRVWFFNQFGDQECVIGKSVYLLVPTEKIEPGSAYSGKFNHFLCYRVLEETSEGQQVTLKDQFDKEPVSANVIKLEYFCPPCQKNKEAIVDPDDHLAIYRIEIHPTPDKERKIKNQFGTYILTIGKARFLGVPTTKKEWKTLK